MVDGGGLENRFPERGRGFESYSLRHEPCKVRGSHAPYMVHGARLLMELGLPRNSHGSGRQFKLTCIMSMS